MEGEEKGVFQGRHEKVSEWDLNEAKTDLQWYVSILSNLDLQKKRS